MPDIHLSIEIHRPPEAVFDVIADITHYSRWLPPSSSYRETVEVSDSPVKPGTTYQDKNPLGVLYGEVREYKPYSRIVFHQAMKNRNLDVTIRYELSPAANETRLERTTSVATGGFLRLLQPIVVRQIRQENQRTIGALKAYLEAQ